MKSDKTEKLQVALIKKAKKKLKHSKKLRLQGALSKFFSFPLMAR
jgi:hypothetical protein